MTVENGLREGGAAGFTHRFVHWDFAENNARIKLPQGTSFVALMNTETAIQLEVRPADGSLTAALDPDNAVDVAAAGSLPGAPVQGGEIIAIETAEAAIGEVTLYIEGAELPPQSEITIDETAP